MIRHVYDTQIHTYIIYYHQHCSGTILQRRILFGCHYSTGYKSQFQVCTSLKKHEKKYSIYISHVYITYIQMHTMKKSGQEFFLNQLSSSEKGKIDKKVNICVCYFPRYFLIKAYILHSYRAISLIKVSEQPQIHPTNMYF